jgi:hypothetical protein
MGSDKYPRRPAGEPVDDPMVARSADRTYEWGPAEIQRKRFPNQPPLYDPSRGKKIKINRGEEAEVGDHLDDFGMIHQIVKISKDGRTVTTDSPKGRRDHHVSAFAHTFKVPPPTQKSESRAAILARGILAAVELRKAVETGGKTMADIIAMDYTTYPGGFAIHPKDTGYGYASGRKLKYPAFKWSDGKYVPAQAGEAEKFLSAHNAATVENDRAGWGIRSS